MMAVTLAGAPSFESSGMPSQNPPAIKQDRVALITRYNTEARRLFKHPQGLDTKNINDLTLEALELALTYPKAACDLFETPYGLSLDMNQLPADKLELVLKFPDQARSLSDGPGFEIQGLLLLSRGKLEFCLDSQKTISKLFNSPVKGMDWDEINALTIEELRMLTVTHRYLNFIEQISRGENFPYGAIAVSLLAPDCEKIFNGVPKLKGRDAFISDLLDVYKSQGSWDVDLVEPASPSQSRKTVTMPLNIDMGKAGTFTAIVILSFNSDFLITRIYEVLTNIDGAYKFDSGSK